jgi:hypothetical protein
MGHDCHFGVQVIEYLLLKLQHVCTCGHGRAGRQREMQAAREVQIAVDRYRHSAPRGESARDERNALGFADGASTRAPGELHQHSRGPRQRSGVQTATLGLFLRVKPKRT